MHVWIINQYVVPPEQAGFTRHYVLARQLVRLGHKVTVVTGSFNHSTRSQIVLEPDEPHRVEVRDGIQFVWIRTKSYAGNGVARMASMLDFASKVRRRSGCQHLPTPDIVLSSTPHLFASAAALKLAATWNVPFVLEVRDLWPQTFVDLGGYSTRHPAIWWMRRIERKLYRAAAKIITLPPDAADHFVAQGASKDDVAWIPNGVDLDLITTPNTPSMRIRSSEFTVMYAGAHGLANDLGTILGAAELLQPAGIRFRFIGDGPEKPLLMRMAQERNLANVSFEPIVSRQQVYEKLQEADLLVAALRKSPLYASGVSLNKLYDFMAVGRPVVFAAQSSNNPIEEAGAGLTVPPHDPAALARGIEQIAQMSALEQTRLGHNGRRFVERHHSAEALGGRLETVLLDALSSGRTCARAA